MYSQQRQAGQSPRPIPSSRLKLFEREGFHPAGCRASMPQRSLPLRTSPWSRELIGEVQLNGGEYRSSSCRARREGQTIVGLRRIGDEVFQVAGLSMECDHTKLACVESRASRSHESCCNAL